MTVKSSLAARCESATADEQRELIKSAADRIWGFSFAPENIHPDVWVKRWAKFNLMLNAYAYVDAVIMLLPEGLEWSAGRLLNGTSVGSIWCDDREHEFEVEASTPALALLAAILKAEK